METRNKTQEAKEKVLRIIGNRFKAKNQYIQYEELRQRERAILTASKRGVKLLHSKSKFKAVCGVVCLSVAIIPNGLGFIFYPIGFYLLAINKQDVFSIKENLLKKIKFSIKLKGGKR